MKEKFEVLFNYLEMVPTPCRTGGEEDDIKTGSVRVDVIEYYKKIPKAPISDAGRSPRHVDQSKVQGIQHHLRAW